MKKKQKHQPVGVLNFQKAERKWERRARGGAHLGEKGKSQKPKKKGGKEKKKDNSPAGCSWFWTRYSSLSTLLQFIYSLMPLFITYLSMGDTQRVPDIWMDTYSSNTAMHGAYSVELPPTTYVCRCPDRYLLYSIVFRTSEVRDIGSTDLKENPIILLVSSRHIVAARCKDNPRSESLKEPNS